MVVHRIEVHDPVWTWGVEMDNSVTVYRCAVRWSNRDRCDQWLFDTGGNPYGGPHTRAFTDQEGAMTIEEIAQFAPRLVWKVTAVPGMWAQIAVVTRDSTSMSKLLGESVTDPSYDGLYADLRSAGDIDALIARLQEVKAEVFGGGGEG